MKDRILDCLLGPPKQEDVSFDSLMPRRVTNLLLVTSLYDCYTFIEDGRLSEMLLSEYLELNLRQAPSVERVSTAEEALERLRSESFDLVISMPRVGEMDVRRFGREVKSIDPALPVVLLASNTRELGHLQPLESLHGIDRVFVWLGDVRLFLAIIKLVEDGNNAWHDARTAGVRSIIVIEDSPQFYSSYLPMLYTELVNQTQALMSEGINRMQKMMRMRARPKIQLATTYEEGLALYERYHNDLLGVILDASFPRDGKADPSAGLDYARMLKAQMPEIPVLIQSGSSRAADEAVEGVQVVDKNSPSLLAELRTFIQTQLGFGEFAFRCARGTVIGRAPDLRSLEWAVQAVPGEALTSASNQRDLVAWLMARTEFELAENVQRVLERRDEGPDRLRNELLQILRTHRDKARAGVVAEFSAGSFEGGRGFVRIGTGSLGGKGRGLAFVDALIDSYGLGDRFEGVKIQVPPTAVLATGVFDQFMEASGLLEMALREGDDGAITEAFLQAKLPGEVVDNLWTFLDWVRYPLAVRSSSLLEDASYQPFAGIYETYMIPNNHPDAEVRLDQLCRAIKLVYASTYHADAKAYIESTPNRLEEEKMAVVIQQVVGRRHEQYLYPDVAGVARSLNYYPMPGMAPEEGVVSAALGFGKTVVDGGRCMRFCPAQPRKPLQCFSPQDYLENTQRTFMALDLSRSDSPSEDVLVQAGLVSLDLDAAEKHGTLAAVGSVYSPDNDAVYDGTSRPGTRLVTMAGILKGRILPLAEILSFLLKAGCAASSCPVEMEFAVSLSDSPGKPSEFGFLQIRPMVLGSDVQDVQAGAVPSADALCVAHNALGNGFLRDIRDILYVRPEAFDRARTSAIATEIAPFNTRLRQEKRPYLLVGPGRWGSGDPWLGIPVKWAQISGARCIIETDLEDIRVEPSQGSHFFHNIMSFGIGYLTVDRHGADELLDLDWLDGQPAIGETRHLRQLRFEDPLEVALNGRRNFGVVLKPGKSLQTQDQ